MYIVLLQNTFYIYNISHIFHYNCISWFLCWHSMWQNIKFCRFNDTVFHTLLDKKQIWKYNIVLPPHRRLQIHDCFYFTWMSRGIDVTKGAGAWFVFGHRKCHGHDLHLALYKSSLQQLGTHQVAPYGPEAVQPKEASASSPASSKHLLLTVV